jgi:phospholipid/cholesterol/gamma-HCH transport system substrate-binding protein
VAEQHNSNINKRTDLMDNEVNYTIVGAFVITLIAAIVITIIWLSSGLHYTPEANYLIYSKESVSGLNLDAPVEFNGVNVGTVKKISLMPHDPHVVRVLISIEQGTPITQGTTATLATRGITGVVYLALKDSGINTQAVVVQEGQDYPVIPTTPSIFVRLDIALTKMSNNLETVSNAFKALLDEKNLESISDSLANIKDITSGLSASTSKLSAIINNTEMASHEFGPVLRDTKNTVKALEVQTLPSFYQMTNSMNGLMKTLNEVSQQLKQNPSVILRGTAPPPLGPGERR